MAVVVFGTGLVGGGAVASPAAVSAVPSVATAGPMVSRLAGADRVETAVAISRHAYPEALATGGSVYLARKDVLADAMAAGTLTDGPVLLVPSCGAVPHVVLDEVARLAPARVVALGGQGAVCDDVLTAVAGEGRSTARLEGLDRYLTSLAIAKERARQGAVTEVYVASGLDSPDAVVAGQLTRGPILLVGSRDVASDYAAFLGQLGPVQAFALGGPAAVSDAQMMGLAVPRPFPRLMGRSRYETASAVALREFPQDADTVYLARGDVYADAVASGALADGPVVLVEQCSLPLAARQRIATARPTRIVALGGTGAVCDDVLTRAAAATSVNGGRTLPLTMDETGWSQHRAGTMALSEDGRFAAFHGQDLEADLGYEGLYLVDRETGAIEEVGVTTAGVSFNSQFYGIDVSRDGRFVVFSTYAPNAEEGDTGSHQDVYLRDRTKRTTTLVSRSTGGETANGDSFSGAISEDGSRVVFSSYATDLVPGDTNGTSDIFSFEVASGELSRVSVDAEGQQLTGRSLLGQPSANGQRIAFVSVVPSAGGSGEIRTLMVRDVDTGAVELASIDPSGRPLTQHVLDSALSDDGTTVVFVTGPADGAGRLMVRDLTSGVTREPKQADGRSIDAFALDGAGGLRWIALTQGTGHSDVRLHDLETGESKPLSVNHDGTPATWPFYSVRVSADGSVVSFSSGSGDVYVPSLASRGTPYVWERLAAR